MGMAMFFDVEYAGLHSPHLQIAIPHISVILLTQLVTLWG